MRKKIYFLMMAAALTCAACQKEPSVEPIVDDTTGGDNPALVEKNSFSVSENLKVRIADGNLQYKPSTNEWRIAPHAWEAVKDANLNCSDTYEGWIDNFLWASSGYNNFFPYSTTTFAGGCSINGTNYDWGQYNDILNADTIDPAGTWRTLTSDEWDYLLNTRSGSTVSGVPDARWALAMVANQPGIILIPDVFSTPEEVVPLRETSINTLEPYATNLYTAEEWSYLQKAGCAFLPSVGCMSISLNMMISVDYLGCYWTSTFVGYVDGLACAGQILFNPNMVELGQVGIGFPRPVRLARNL